MPRTKTYQRQQRSRDYARRRFGPIRTPQATYTRRSRQFVSRTMGPFSVSESKYFDSYLANSAIAEGDSWQGTELDPATLDTLVVPTEGSDIDNRIGRKISIYKIALRGLIANAPEQNAGDIFRSPAYRFILYLDQQTNGVQSQGEELMAAPGTASLPLTFLTFQNLSNLGRFRVLRDVVIRPRDITSGTDGTNTTSQNLADIPFRMVVKFRKPIVMKFNSTSGGTVGDIVDNSFHLIGQKSGAGFASSLYYQCRAYYKDA